VTDEPLDTLDVRDLAGALPVVELRQAVVQALDAEVVAGANAKALSFCAGERFASYARAAAKRTRKASAAAIAREARLSRRGVHRLLDG
jgi:hypothetical protein